MLDLALLVLILNYNHLPTAVANDELGRLDGHRSSGRPDDKRGDMYGGDDLSGHDVSKRYGGGDKFGHIVPERVDVEHCTIGAVISRNDEAEVGRVVGARDDKEGIVGNSLLFYLTSRH